MATVQYDHSYIFRELNFINNIRNRIAHHEPICFLHDQETISTVYFLNCYRRILTLFSWMDIDTKSLLYGLDHIQNLSQKIDLINNK